MCTFTCAKRTPKSIKGTDIRQIGTHYTSARLVRLLNFSGKLAPLEINLPTPLYQQYLDYTALLGDTYLWVPNRITYSSQQIKILPC